jgi:hypothetical protein
MWVLAVFDAPVRTPSTDGAGIAGPPLVVRQCRQGGDVDPVGQFFQRRSPVMVAIPKPVCRVFYDEGDCNSIKKLSWSQLGMVRKCTAKARSEAQKRYPMWSQEDGPGDAFRHAYWSSLMTRDLGFAVAKYVGDQHENIAGGNDAKKKEMDLHNNHLGRQIALANPVASDEVLAKACGEAITKGRAKVIFKTKAEWEAEMAKRPNVEPY